VRVVLYLLHILFTPLDRLSLCLANLATPHHHPNRQPPTSSILHPPGPELRDYSRRDGHRWHTYHRYMVIGTIHRPRRSCARSLEILGRSAHPTLLRHSALWPMGFPTASARALVTQTQITTPQHSTANNPRYSDARCNDIGTWESTHLSSYAQSYSAPCSP
jgi:hypothetical protein